MFESLLISNRGEIARRIMRTARRLGIRTIAVYSDADSAAPYVREADEAVRIGGPAPQGSYLNGPVIIEAARKTGASAIHPGYGFLSENAEFAELVIAAGLVWVGAPPAAIRAMGLKDQAKRLMQAAHVPVTPGYFGEDQNDARLRAEAEIIGPPLLIKAVAGGGGKGMRRVDRLEDFEAALASCRRESRAAFGDDRVLIEKYVLSPRHIEVQVFGDHQGAVVHLFERDCSIQRRHQKIIEEAPAPGLDEGARASLCDIAVRAAHAVSYVGAGTIEFIADASEGLRSDRIWFMEMNTRLQVEHPVTEAITGEDLVEWQLRIAAGEPLPKRQDEIARRGWAMEGRLYAEDPSNGFLPSVGPLAHFRLPANVRIDSGFEQGDEISPYYDPMLAKIIVSADDRERACARLAQACRAIEIWPLKTNAAFLARVASQPEFIRGQIDTAFLERHADLLPDSAPSAALIACAARALGAVSPDDPWTSLTGLRIGSPPDTNVRLRIGGELRDAHIGDEQACASFSIIESGDARILFEDGKAWPFCVATAEFVHSAENAGSGSVEAIMPGRIVSIDVVKGARVAAGQRMMAMEAMKMEHVLRAPFDGTVADIFVKVDDRVRPGASLALVERASGAT